MAVNFLFELFCGEFVRLLLIKDSKQTVEHGGTIKTIQQPLTIEGFLIEADDDYYYLGLSPQVISKAIHKSQIVQIEIINPTKEEDELLNEIVDVPDSENGIN